eukprot:TRINITY_DN6853_c0_g1_i1.p1 TRINITY_DN6853_c0_g1~~TRINITY_DN6853_c0_g1_i1.p1  ORF type:complete len:577 (+),score=67.91 TRINITY_DN6853_c0_g1_i1:77-1807(+)
MNDKTTSPQTIVSEYFSLVEKSQQLFSGLRDLPQIGKQWQPYFQKTFELYTELWRFQQNNRSVLQNSEHYGLQRWEIGEIASKIGQLYYHYYLRTSETSYLQQSYVFYDAIRSRDYFQQVFEAKNILLVVKKLRYYARYIVVCLLLNKRKMVKTLEKELRVLVEMYIKTFKTADTNSWKLVLEEISTFLKVDAPLKICDRKESGAVHHNQSNRLNLPPSTLEGKVRIQEAIIVGNRKGAVKLSELTLDMFRIMQVLEREDVGGVRKNNAQDKESGNDGKKDTKNEEESRTKKRMNPQKFLLYRPTFEQLLVFLATAHKELNPSNVLLLYLSADGKKDDGNIDKEEEMEVDATNTFSVARGGLAMYSGSDSGKERGIQSCLYPGDLMPFLRKKFFLIVESGFSNVFTNLESAFGSYFLCLLSPTRSNSVFGVKGNIFTLFLHKPLTAFCELIGKKSITQKEYDTCMNYIQNSFKDVQRLLCNFEGIPDVFHHFLEEDFLRVFILRFIFCHSTLYLLTSIRKDSTGHLPRSHPALPSEFLSHSTVTSVVLKLASYLSAVSAFTNPNSNKNAADNAVHS